MSKLAAQDKFLDLSDYGRTFGKFFALQLKNTHSHQFMLLYFSELSGIMAIYSILNGLLLLADFFIILKSGIDAADGELARIKETHLLTLEDT